MNKLGKKGREWSKVRAQLKKEFFDKQITRCEMCNSDFGLSFAHSKKRRNIVGDEIFEVALLCIEPCHRRLESLPENEMTEQIQQIISDRNLKI